MFLDRFFRPRATLAMGQKLYAGVVAQARTPALYEAYGVPDTVEGRFELYTVHVFLLLDRLRGQGARASETSQALFDTYLGALDDALRESGLPESALHVLSCDFSLDGAYRGTLALLEESRRGRDGRLPFDAIFAANDLMAVGALRALKQKQVAVPDEVEVIGFDDIELASLVEPPLTTVSQPTLEMGAHSAELLLRLVAGEKPRTRTVTLKPRLVLRETTRGSVYTETAINAQTKE